MDGNNLDFDKLERYKAEYRCMRCKRRTMEEMIVCEECREFQYCSIQCLKEDRESHKEVCNKIGLKKGLLVLLESDTAKYLTEAKTRAKFLNDQGDFCDGISHEDDSSSDEDGAQKVPQARAQSPGASGSKRNKEKKNKQSQAEKGDAENTPKDSRDEYIRKKTSKTLSAQSVVSNGRFGGPARCDAKIRSGESFGEGWWKPKSTPASKKTGDSSTVNRKKEKGAAEANPTGGPTFTDLYHDSDDNLENSENEKTKKAEGSSETASASEGASLEEAMAGLELVGYDAKKAEEEMERSREGERASAKTGKCFYCHKVGPVKTCSRCEIAEYCGKDCQKSDFEGHKAKCKHIHRFKVATTKVTPPIRVALAMSGLGRISMLLSELPDYMSRMFLGVKQPILLEIAGPHPHLFRHGAILRDMVGQVTQVLFYDDSIIYHHLGAGLLGFGVPLPLPVCLRPGNFILFLDTHWHHFMDGTVGIRIDDLDMVHFIFMDNN